MYVCTIFLLFFSWDMIDLISLNLILKTKYSGLSTTCNTAFCFLLLLRYFSHAFNLELFGIALELASYSVFLSSAWTICRVHFWCLTMHVIPVLKKNQALIPCRFQTHILVYKTFWNEDTLHWRISKWDAWMVCGQVNKYFLSFKKHCTQLLLTPCYKIMCHLLTEASYWHYC